MDWNIDDETLRTLGGERLIVTLDVAELAPGTYIYLNADDEIIMRGAILDAEDFARGIPFARTDFGSDEYDDRDTDPEGCTIVGLPMTPRAPAFARATTLKGIPIPPRPPVSSPDQISNEIEDDDCGGPTTVGSPIQPRQPAAKGKQ